MQLLASGVDERELIEVFVGREYTIDDANMRLWCIQNIHGYWSAGTAPAQILNFKIKEVPWLFERENEAMLFMLRWQ